MLIVLLDLVGGAYKKIKWDSATRMPIHNIVRDGIIKYSEVVSSISPEMEHDASCHRSCNTERRYFVIRYRKTESHRCLVRLSPRFTRDRNSAFPRHAIPCDRTSVVRMFLLGHADAKMNKIVVIDVFFNFSLANYPTRSLKSPRFNYRNHSFSSPRGIFKFSNRGVFFL